MELVLGPLWAITPLGGLILPVPLIFNSLITIILFGWFAWLIDGFRLKKGFFSAIFWAVADTLSKVVVLRVAFGLVDVYFNRAALITMHA